MKTVSLLAMIIVSIAIIITSCNRTAGARYIDLTTGNEVELVRDDATGLMVEVNTNKPVYMYVDTETRDTIYGSTGKVINGKVFRLDDGAYRYNGEYEVKNNVGEYKVKVEDDGDYKIKTDDKKIKVDDGERKVKND